MFSEKESLSRLWDENWFYDVIILKRNDKIDKKPVDVILSK
jgi:hypothetical protein